MSYFFPSGPTNRGNIDRAITFPVYVQRLSPVQFSNPCYLLKAPTGELRYQSATNNDEINTVRNDFINDTFESLPIGSIGIISVSNSDVLSNRHIRPITLSYILLDKQHDTTTTPPSYERRMSELHSFPYTKDPSVQYHFLKAIPTQKITSAQKLRTLMQKEPTKIFIVTELQTTEYIFTVEGVGFNNTNTAVDIDDDSDEEVVFNDITLADIGDDSDGVPLIKPSRFDDDRYLGTDEVDGYISLMKPHFPSNVAVFPAAYWIAVTRNNKHKLDALDESVLYYTSRSWFQRIGTADTVHVPIVISRHWILATIDFSQHRILTYNSLEFYSYNREVVAHNLKWLAYHLKPTSIDTEWDFDNSPGCKQTDGYNCGIFVLHRLRLEILNDVPTEFDADTMRDRFKHEYHAKRLLEF